MIKPLQTAHGAPASRWRRLFAGLAIAGMLATVSVATATHTAWAADYPSWNDVLKARQDEKAAAAQVTRIEALIKGLEDEVARTDEIAKQKGEEFEIAQRNYDDAAYRAQLLQEQADAAQAIADESKLKAGKMAASLSRTGGKDLSSTLFFNGDNATDLLSQLGMASKIANQSQSLYDKAVQDQNTAQALTNQANVAKDALEALKIIAEDAMWEAQLAYDNAAKALAEQQSRIATLQAQLATLKTDRVHTESEYVKGVQERWGAGAGSGEISAQGWTRPAAGRVTSPFGNRLHPVDGVWRLHAGTDIGASCNAPIFAAHSGTVNFTGWNGGSGYYVRIDHGNGVATGYAHIVTGGIMVQNGQQVSVGQQIARVGTTGTSTGCHLHFDLRINGVANDPVPYLKARGITLG